MTISSMTGMMVRRQATYILSSTAFTIQELPLEMQQGILPYQKEKKKSSKSICGHLLLSHQGVVRPGLFVWLTNMHLHLRP